MRQVLAVLAGYVAMALFVMVTFSATWMILGSSFAFESGSLHVTTGWMAIALVLSAVAAVLGGWTAGKIGGIGAVRGLAILVLVLGFAMAIAHLKFERPVPPKPIAQLKTFEAANYAVQPTWYDFTLPFIGAVGAMVGGSLLTRRETQETAAA